MKKIRQLKKWSLFVIILILLSIIIIPFTFSKYLKTFSKRIVLNIRKPEYDVVFIANKNNLPSGYTELEYIESTGEQYILTDIVPTDTTGIDITFKFLHKQTEQVYFGTGNTDNSAGYWFGSNNTRGYFRWDILYSGSRGNIDYVNVAENQLLNVKMNYKNNRKLIYNEKTYFNGLPTLAAKTLPFTIFGYNNDIENEVTLMPNMKLYNFKVTDGDNIIADFVPCYRNSDEEAGLYDIVNNHFYSNAGSGEFIKGVVTQHFVYGTAQNLEANTYQRNSFAFTMWNTSPDGTGTSYTDEELVNNLTTIDGDIINLYAQWEDANTIYNFYPNTKGLPNEYAELDYIEGTGTQYIITDIIPDDNTGAYIKMKNKDVRSNLVYFGSGNASINDGFWIGNSNSAFYARWDILYSRNQGNLINNNTNISNNVLSTFELNYLNNRTFKYKNNVYVDNLPAINNKTLPIVIFGYYSSSDNTIRLPAKMQLHEFKISQGSNIIRNYVPCYRVSDGIVGLYETYTNTFYSSESDDAFIKGTETKTTQKIYYQTSDNLNPNPFTNGKYIFDSWNTLPDGTGTSYTDEQLITNNNSNNETINLYAQWRNVIVTFDANGGTVSTQSKEVTYGE